MKAKTTVFFVVLLTICAWSAQGASFIGTPSPSLSPVFGVLVNFDDRATGTPVLAGDYASVGLASITELTGAGAAFARYAGSQSAPNYIGTGPAYELNGNGSGWDGTIQFRFANATGLVGIGIADSAFGPETVSIFDSSHTLLESIQAPNGANVYVGFARGTNDIAYLEVTGDFFALDDLQFNIPEPASIALLGGVLCLIGARLRRRSVAR